MDYIAQPKDYWIATNAINITRNALGKPNRIQCSVASGAAILCYIEGVAGLGYDNGHRFRTWPLTISPTYFNSNTEKYVYVAIPRNTSVGTQAIVVFPSEQLDIYGINADDEQVGSTDYYYIWLQGILTATDGTSNREWQQTIDFGKKGTDEDLYDDTSSEWFQYSKVNNVVTFLKNIRMKAGTTFQNLILGNKELTGVATSNTAYTDSDALVATPGYVESQYLSKTHESTAQEQVGFLKGLWIKAKGLFGFDKDGNAKVNDLNVAGGATVVGEQGLKIGTFSSGLLGSGAAIAPSGHAEFESIYSRSFISTPEFRFNRISVTEGEQWCTNGYGTIESVTVGEDENGNAVQNGGLITLHLEENDFASVDVGDICRGIYNDIENTYQTATVEDDKVIAAGTSAQEGSGIGFPAKTGFFTSYFYIARIVKNVKGECQFIYGLRKSTTPHPCAFMKFAQYGSFTNSERRASSYSSSMNHAYEMRLQGVSTWQIQTANIVSREGWLGDLTIEMADHTMRTLQGYGLYVQDNVYFGNAVIQLDPYTIEMLERDLATYKADFSEYIDMVVVDDTGNVIGGLWTDTQQQGGTTERTYRIHSAITVRRSGVLLTEASADADAGTGTYKLYVIPVNCTCIVENSTIYITGISNIKDGVAGSSDDANFDYDAMRAMESCRVDIVIDCEGKTSLVKTLPINIKHDSQPYVGADITNEFSAVSWNTKNQAYIGLPIVFDMKMWHNDEGLDIASVNDVSVTPAVTGMTVGKAIATLANGQKVARITISALPESLPLVQELNVTCVAMYAGVSYERTLVHTINKSTDTNVYSLIPSVSEVMHDKNTSTLNVNSIDCSVFCDSSDNKHYEVTYANFGTHEIGLFYKKFYADGTSDADETEYTGTAISINTSVKEVMFYLYKKVGATVDRTVKHDQEGVPVIAEGQDGKGVEYIFITQQSWDGTDADKPTIYDVAADRQVDNYCPYTDAQHSAQWTDEPTGVGANMRWEFQAMRKKVNGVWQPFGDVKYKDHYVVDGTTPYAIDLSNEQSQVACNENGGVVGGYEKSRLMLFKGTSYAFTDFPTITITPYNITCNGSSSAFTLTAAQKAAAQSDGYFELTPSSITADSATISVSAVYGNITLVAVYRINKSYAGKNAVIYSLQTSLDTIRKNKNGTLVDDTLTIQVKKTVGATSSILTTAQQLSNEGLVLKYENASTVSPQTITNAVSIATSTFVGSGGTWGKIMIVKDNVIIDSERINVVTDGQDGTSPYFADIDNEMDSVALDTSGKTTAAYSKTFNVMLWHGSTEMTLTDIVISGTTAAVTATKNVANKTVTISVAANTSIPLTTELTITPQATGAPNDQSVHFILNGVKPGANGEHAAIYTLIPSVSSVVKKKDGTYSVNNVSCTRQKNVGGTITDNTLDGTIYYELDNDGTEHGYTNNTDIAVSNFTKSIKFIYEINGITVDVETILMVDDGEDGDNAFVVTLDRYGYVATCNSDDELIANLSFDIQVIAKYGSSDVLSDCTITASISDSDWDTPTVNAGVVTVGASAGTSLSRQTDVTIVVTHTTYGSRTLKCSISRSSKGQRGQSITGPTGPMYYPAGLYDASQTYTVTDKLVPVVVYSGTYYYAKKTVPADRGYYPTNTEYWGAFSNFAAAFVQILFASYAMLGAFIVNGNFFISQKGTINGTDSDNYTDENFVPYLKMNAFTGEIFAKKGTIGGFEIGDDYIGIANNTSGVFSGCRIYKDGRIILGNTTENYAFRSSGGVEMIGQGKGITITENSGSSVNHDKYVNITGWVKLNVVDRHQEGSSAESISGLAANELYRDGYGFVRYRVNDETTPLTVVNSFGEIHVKTNMYNAGYRRINISRGNCTLPAGVPIGTVFYVKGLGSTVVTTESNSDGIERWDDSTNVGNSVAIQSNSVQFVKTSSNLWTMFLGA